MSDERKKMSAELYELICKDKFETLGAAIEGIRTLILGMDSTYRDKLSDTTSRVSKLEAVSGKISANTIIASAAVLIAAAAVIVPIIV